MVVPGLAAASGLAALAYSQAAVAHAAHHAPPAFRAAALLPFVAANLLLPRY